MLIGNFGIIRLKSSEISEALINYILVKMKKFAVKKGMTHIYKDGKHVAVTVLELPKTIVCRVDSNNDKCHVVVGLAGNKKKIPRSILGQSKGLDACSMLTEFSQTQQCDLKKGEEVSLEKMGLQEGEVVSVISRTKGKGFQGTVKRHNFSTGPKTHGSRNWRAPGSIGGGYPQRVIKGQKMPGHMGDEQRTVDNLIVERVDIENNQIWLSGAVPGANKSVLIIKK
ncbi:50S ribosomal protein L3 [Candidatus Berkelbacteria bacterium CG10_big_fil_rev_8_21_14_0_10_41_12]|uniref:50S ribosomal protein L3 n=1 Tax=Candidatus Berkelbacteria bacterium CG10_big_fil_rev_8_21_14_0_10_41_12 TaxID=1974513 RepID=A0A2M6WXX9_9BACT|nr:MAG: 50S ribosomal protein L3 [Candidatus Berkelbacteria bacterium CG10_big_fil_rev_8_21_14_0_10_41_12]